MKKYILYFLILSTVYSCTKGDYQNNKIISEDDEIYVENLLMLINIQNSDSTYLITHRIDSLSIYINDSLWGYFSSSEIDTAKINKEQSGNYFFSNNKQNYFFIGNVLAENEFETVGDYATFMNAYNTLKPGDCMIESYQIVDINGLRKTFYPYKYFPFSVEENVGSMYIGEINLNFN